MDFTRKPLLGPQIREGRCFGLYVKCPYLLAITTEVTMCVGLEDVCTQVTVLDNPAAGSRDTPGSVQWSICKVPLFRDRS